MYGQFHSFLTTFIPQKLEEASCIFNPVIGNEKSNNRDMCFQKNQKKLVSYLGILACLPKKGYSDVGTCFRYLDIIASEVNKNKTKVLPSQIKCASLFSEPSIYFSRHVIIGGNKRIFEHWNLLSVYL